jgi:hypothetical protein
MGQEIIIQKPPKAYKKNTTQLVLKREMRADFRTIFCWLHKVGIPIVIFLRRGAEQS